MQKRFEVTKILDTNTFEATPFREWCGEPGHEAVQNRLMELLFGERVTLTDPEAIKADALICTVQVDGQNLAEHFPAYR